MKQNTGTCTQTHRHKERKKERKRKKKEEGEGGNDRKKEREREREKKKGSKKGVKEREITGIVALLTPALLPAMAKCWAEVRPRLRGKE